MIKIGNVLLEATEELEREKGIAPEIIFKSLCDAMVAAYKKHAKGTHIANISGIINEKTGEIGILRTKEVVEEVHSEHTEIEIKEAKQIEPECEIGDEIQVDVTPNDFGRIAAQSAKQVITQRIREAERQLILDEFLDKKGTLLTGVIRRVESRNVIVNIGKTDAILPQREQTSGEYFRINERIRVYVLDVKETTRLPQVIVSQIHPKIVQELFELEVPEIEDGIIEIKNIAREAGYRTKIAVRSTDPNVDPVGACIGQRGSRIQTIVNELKNEKIDIVRYVDNPAEYIVNALSPAKIISVEVFEDYKEALVVVPDDQLSLAIGKEGQNVRLAHRLTGWKIDIKSLSQYEEQAEKNAAQEEENIEEVDVQEIDVQTQEEEPQTTEESTEETPEESTEETPEESTEEKQEETPEESTEEKQEDSEKDSEKEE